MTRKAVSSYFNEHEPKTAELLVREAFLQTATDLLDGTGVDDYSITRIKGALMLLEKFAELEENN